ncbi:hypothetical protein ACLB2K_036707 [Fragaria x ananassa]
MRTSCNGCRVLRKGCSENCEIRPCIKWIKSPESQANATLFLAKFYGRAGLLNLINAGAQHQRPGIFKSLLYEACGRIVNPTFGSVGLLSSGNWVQCQAAVDAVLAGLPIVENNEPVPYLNPVPPVNSCDIRHVSKDTSLGKTRNRFKRSRSARSRRRRRNGVGSTSLSLASALVEEEVREACSQWKQWRLRGR